MIKNIELSETAKTFYKILEDNYPSFLPLVKVVSPSHENRYVEPNSIVIVIPARVGFLFTEIYIETRSEDILIAFGTIHHRHFSWWSEDVIEQQMCRAISLVIDIINEKVVFIKTRNFLSRKIFYIDIPIEDLSKQKRVLEIFSWNGTFDKKIGL
jgi:hypothetical protein